jgi:hypothetical protein
MTSAAWDVWDTVRRDRIRELRAAHKAVGGTARGRRWRTQQLNWSLILRIAAEFQGYARDLHDLSVDDFARTVAGTNAGLETVLRERLTSSRLLDKGNANPGALGSDFGRLGIDLWPALSARTTAASGWNADLEALIEVRNAIAHAREHELAGLRARGYPTTLRMVFTWLGMLDHLAVAMDEVVADQLSRLLGTAAPW